MMPIKRTFVSLKDDGPTLEKATLLARLGYSSEIDWDELLKSERVLIASEAGTGKSHECRARAHAMFAQGLPAFYVELRTLAQFGLRESIFPEHVTRFDEWKAGKADFAIFFLDSIDELKLTTLSFAAALTRFRLDIGDNLGRVRVVLTSRHVPTDLHLARQYLPIPMPLPKATKIEDFADTMVDRYEVRYEPPKKNEDQDWRAVALVPLSHSQIQAFASNRGVADHAAFLADVLARNAEDFARHPLSLIGLCDDWKAGRRIRSLREQIERDTEVKLAPRADRDEAAQLSQDRALEGASRLALANFLTRKFIIRFRSEGVQGVEAALESTRILQDWSPKEQQALLERALFAISNYGCVRIHHPSVVEFLGAARLDRLISRGMPIKTVKRRLFEDAFGNVKLVRPRMRPIAAWLAASYPSIFEEILDREPEAILNHADPSIFDLGQKKRALRAYVDRYGRGGWRGMHVPRVQVRRFGSSDLAPEVLLLWASGIENPDVRELLCELIDAAQLVPCAEIVRNAAKDPKEDEGVRIAALRALTKVDRSAVAELVQSMDTDHVTWPDSLLRLVIPLLFPACLSVEELLRLVKRRKPSGRRHDSFEWLLDDTISKASINAEDLVTLCVGLKTLVEEGLAWQKSGPHIVTKRPELILSLAGVCLRLFDLKNRDPSAIEAAILVIKLAEHSHRTEKKVSALKECFATLSDPDRELAFWLADRIVANLHPIADPWIRLFETADRGPILLSFAQDQAWVSRILADKVRPKAERQMMLCAMTHFLSHQAQDRVAFLNGLRAEVQDDADLTSQLESFLKPATVDPQHAKFERDQARRKLEHERKKASQRAEWAAFERRIKDDPDTEFGEEKAESTCWNLWHAMRRSEDGRDDAGWDPAFIEAHFGPQIATRLRDAMRSIWRKHRPTLWHERALDERNTHYTIWDFGLAALHAEAEAPNWARRLTVADAELAARYAPVQLNGFPKWLEALIEAHADAVERTLGPAVIAELDEAIDTGAAAMTLQCVRYSPAPVAKIFVPRLKEWLIRHHRRFIGGDAAPPGLSHLWYVSDILIAHDGDAKSWFVPIAESALSGAPSKAFDTFWLSVLFRLDPAKGTDALECQLAKTEAAREGLAIGWFAGMFGDSREPSVDLSHAGFTPDVLSRLVKLAYRHVRPDSDPVHEDVYSPGPRDDAASARNRLLGAFLDAKGPEAWRLKVEIADDPLIAHFRDRFRMLIRGKLAEEIETDAMTEEQVVQFERSFEVAPKTRDQMFQILQDRLDDLDDLLNQDTSPRAAWAFIEIEKVMRQSIAHELKQWARGAYTVDQEGVTAEEKETDIRLRSTAADQQGVIELKIGGGRSGRDLRDTLQTQIVEKYMAPENCRAGCLLVTVAKSRSWEDPETGASLDIDGLRRMLEREAEKIETENGGKLRLFVKVLDLRPRLAKK